MQFVHIYLAILLLVLEAHAVRLSDSSSSRRCPILVILISGLYFLGTLVVTVTHHLEIELC
jgi:hypothetical protein